MHSRSALAVRSVVVLALVAPGAAHAADTYKIDPVHSSIIFRVMHFGVAPVYGWFRQLSGSFTLDEKEPQRSSVSVVVEAASIYTGDKQRDQHLRSPDFFNVKQYPKLSFTSAKVARAGKTWTLSGKLELHGAVRPVTVELAQLGSAKDPFGKHRIGFEGKLLIRRSAFGMTKMIGPAGDEVTLLLAFEGIKQ
jgi:polyisoprenoid-binding protein YceI